MNRVRAAQATNPRKVTTKIDMGKAAEDITEIAQEEPREITDKIESAEGTTTNTTLDFRARTRRRASQPLTVRCPSRRAI